MRKALLPFGELLLPPSGGKRTAKDKLLTVEEVAEQLGVGIETVRRWIRSKDLQAIELGGRAGYRIPESALDRFIRER